ncbi:hypothetical protein KI387_025489, partial [Taxus chinensis]
TIASFTNTRVTHPDSRARGEYVLARPASHGYTSRGGGARPCVSNAFHYTGSWFTDYASR